MISIKNKLKALRALALAGAPARISAIEFHISKLEAITQSLQSNLENTKSQSIITISDKEILAKLYNGSKIYLNPADIAVVPHMALDGIWEPSITAAWTRLVRQKNMVFDIGANFGYFGLLAARELGGDSASKVIMFEANPYLLPYVHKTLSVNWLNERASIENLAISDKKGKTRLTILKDYIGCSSLQSPEELQKYLSHKMDVVPQETVEVEAVSIDQYCKEHSIAEVDLIKLDIEGFEEKAYNGMQNMIKKSPDLTMFVEFTKDAYPDAKHFYSNMLKDFPFIYLINEDGSFYKPSNASYESVIEKAPDWTMLVLSKKTLNKG